MTTETLKSITRDGVTLRYKEAGSGDPPLLFVHGWTCNLTNWRGQVPHFAGKHRVAALDLRGHGESDKPDQDYTIAGFVDDVAWLIGELGLRKPVVIGHSMGGVIALNLAHTHPDLASAIVMVDSPLALPETMAGLQEQILAGLNSPAYKEIFKQLAAQFFFNADSPPALVEEVVASAAMLPQRVLVTALANTLDRANDVAGAIPVPSLFIRASTHLATEDQLRGRFPGMSLATITSAHFVQMEKPDETNGLIERFLEGLS